MQAHPSGRIVEQYQAEMVAAARRQRMTTPASFEVRVQRVTPRWAQHR